MVFCLATFNAGAERYYYFEHIKATDGLPSNSIYCTIQDRSGFMWIGTKDGLCRYDGHNFTSIDEIAPELSTRGMVTALTEDNLGRIWFSSTDGIYYYNPVTYETGALGIPEKDSCKDIYADSKGNIWFACSNSLFRYDTANSGIHSYAVGGSNPRKIASDNLGMTWVLVEDGNVYVYDRLKDTFKQQPIEHKIKTIEGTADGRMLAATTDNNVILIDCLTLKSRIIYQNTTNKEILCIQEAAKGEFWIGTDSGIQIRREGESYFGEAQR